MITLYTWLLIPGFDPFMLTVLNKKKETRRTVCQHDGLQVKRSTFETWPDHSFDFLGKTFHSHRTNVHPQVYNSVPVIWSLTKSVWGEGGGYLSWTNYHPKKNKVIPNSPELLIWQLHQSCCLLLVVLSILNDTISLFPWRKKYHSGLKKL